VRSTLGGPAMLWLLALIAGMTVLSAWIVATVTRPLRVLSDEVATAAREGFNAVSMGQAPRHGSDEFGRLHDGFRQLLATLRAQWTRLAEVDRFRREGVSNLSHDLRSPLTATAACLETLQRRWGDDATRSDDRQLVDIALRNARNAAALVRSLGDLALLDEPAFKLAPMLVDVGEVLDDIARRFADRAGQQGVTLACEPAGEAAPFAQVDIELFERAVANLLDNALKFTPAGGRIRLGSEVRDGRVCVTVADSGAGIAAADLPHLFDRLYQGRADGAPASAEGGKGLGLAIVRRIVDLHGGEIDIASQPGQGTVVRIRLPPA
jgi:signal transduction histidine kinase